MASELSEWDTRGVAELPTGTVTFLFTDLEGSTRLWEQHPDEMRDALARHDEILHTAIEKWGGVVFSEMGDGMSTGPAARAPRAAQIARDRVAPPGVLADHDRWKSSLPREGPAAAELQPCERRPEQH